MLEVRPSSRIESLPIVLRLVAEKKLPRVGRQYCPPPHPLMQCFYPCLLGGRHTCPSFATIGQRYISCCSSCGLGRGKFALGMQLTLGQGYMLDDRSSCGCGDMLVRIYDVADIIILGLTK